MTGLIVAVLAHPDDETFMIGGTLALYASRGYDVHVLYGPFGPEPDGSPTPHRRAEMEAASTILGISGHTFLSQPGAPQAILSDHAAASYQPGAGRNPAPTGNLHLHADAIAAEIRRLNPDAIITFDATGGTGNLEHILMGAATLRAVETLGPGGATPRLYAAVFGRRLLAAGLRIGRLMRRRGLDDQRAALRIAQESQRPTTVIDVRSVLERRREAARCYKTALAEGDWWMRRWELLSPRARRLLAPRELFARLLPPPRAGEGLEEGELLD